MNRTALKTILLTIVALLSLSASAQRKKNVMVHMTTGQKISNNDLQKIHAKIVEGLSLLPTINILDPSNDGAEVDMHFKCNVDSIEVYKKDAGEGKKKYITCINMRANVCNGDENVDTDGWSIPFYAYNSLILANHYSAKESCQSALDWIAKKTPRKLWEPFAVTGKVLSVEKVEKNKAKELSVAIGTTLGAAAKQEFDIYLPDPMIRDKKGNLKENKPIGKVKIRDLGDDVTLCEVKGGHDKIYSAFLEDPNQLTAKSKAYSESFIENKKFQAQEVAEYAFMISELLNCLKETYTETRDMF